MADSAPPPADLPELIGRYRVVRLLGEGAMGRVLLAHDPVLDREVAVKHLRADLQIPEAVRRGLVKRMRHEARAAARVMHPHLVTLHDMGEDDRVGLYLVFEYVAGPTLKERVARGRMTPKEAARAAVELGTALSTAHEAGILHRDIKPENVILSKKGAKIADFGIAKIPDSTLTHQGGLMGTPAYSAPETFRTSTFSPESDQFSLAATLYEAASGKRAFPGDDAVAVAQRILHENAEPFAVALELPDAVDTVFARALSRRPRERFASCEAFGKALSDALLSAPSGSSAGPASSSEGGPSAGSGSSSAARSASGATSSSASSAGDASPEGVPSSASRSSSGDVSSTSRSSSGDVSSTSRSSSGATASSAGATASSAGATGDARASQSGRGGRTGAVSARTGATDALPRERRGSHIVLGVIAVAITGMLLVRTALKNNEEAPPAVPSSTASATAPVASTASPRPPKTPPVRPPRLTSTTTSPGPDAGAPGVDPGSTSDPVTREPVTSDPAATSASGGAETSPGASGAPSPTSAPSGGAPAPSVDPTNAPLRPR